MLGPVQPHTRSVPTYLRGVRQPVGGRGEEPSAAGRPRPHSIHISTKSIAYLHCVREAVGGRGQQPAAEEAGGVGPVLLGEEAADEVGHVGVGEEADLLVFVFGFCGGVVMCGSRDETSESFCR